VEDEVNGEADQFHAQIIALLSDPRRPEDSHSEPRSLQWRL
jgi:hypothetical protein